MIFLDDNMSLKNTNLYWSTFLTLFSFIKTEKISIHPSVHFININYQLLSNLLFRQCGDSGIFEAMKVQALVAQLCLTLCDSVDYSPPGSSVRAILWERTLEWPLPSSGDLPSKNLAQVSCTAGRFFTIWTTREAVWGYNIAQILENILSISSENRNRK